MLFLAMLDTDRKLQLTTTILERLLLNSQEKYLNQKLLTNQ
jgi:hypothetical protein